MQYFRPASIDEAIAVLASNEQARCLAGGVSLVAQMNAGAVQPRAIVSLADIAELKGIKDSPDGLRVAAMTTHADVAGDDRLTDNLALLRDAARAIGDPGIRAVGTIGGSLAHADPAADYPTALLALNARIEVVGSNGMRLIDATDFFLAPHTTVLKPTELISAIVLPASEPKTIGLFRKVTRSEGDFATVSMALLVRFDGQACSSARVAVGACAPTPICDAEVNEALIGLRYDDDAIAAIADRLAVRCSPIDDVRGSASYRLNLVRRLLPRLLGEAYEASRGD